MPEKLTVDVLRDVSRSFYLSIRVLPRAMREPVGLAYLLARASDTLADAAQAPAEQRMRALTQLREIIDGSRPISEAAELGMALQPPHKGEQVLLQRLPECLERYRVLSERDGQSVQTVLERIIEGQMLDVERFSDPARVAALPDASALEEYTYLVAGCVGEFWTELGLRHVAGYGRSDEGEMRRLGVDFGKGLQLVNVLRDLPEDLKNGRCYLPAYELAVAGLVPAQVALQPKRAEAVVRHWIARAGVLLDRGGIYVERVRPWRLRLAVFLPWYLGVRTLALLRKTPPLEARERVKVTRQEVRRALWLGLRCALSNRMMEKTRENLRVR